MNSMLDSGAIYILYMFMFICEKKGIIISITLFSSLCVSALEQWCDDDYKTV